MITGPNVQKSVLAKRFLVGQIPFQYRVFIKSL